jgi:hypothetical protein
MREVAIVFWVVFGIAAVAAVQSLNPLIVILALIAFGAAGVVTATAGKVKVASDGTVEDKDFLFCVLGGAMAIAALTFVLSALCSAGVQRLLIAAVFGFGIAVAWSYAVGKRRIPEEQEEKAKVRDEKATAEAARKRQEQQERQWEDALQARELERLQQGYQDEDDEALFGRVQSLINHPGTTSQRITMRHPLGQGEVEVMTETDARVEAELHALEEKKQQLLQLRQGEW